MQYANLQSINFLLRKHRVFGKVWGNSGPAAGAKAAGCGAPLRGNNTRWHRWVSERWRNADESGRSVFYRRDLSYSRVAMWLSSHPWQELQEPRVKPQLLRFQRKPWT